MASTFERFLRRFPSELGWAPGKLIPPVELDVNVELSSGKRDGVDDDPDGLDSFEGFGVP